MSGWWDRIRGLWRSLWRKRHAAASISEPPPQPTPEPPPAPEQPPPPASHPLFDRRDQQIRALELARLRHDKFVKPKGERPKRERAPRPPKPTPVIASAADDEPIPVGVVADVNDADKLIADEWMEGDGQGNVLYLEREFYGEFNFRDSILDQLDRYWVYLERMRKHDATAYALCSKVGATLVPYSASFTNRIHGKLHEDKEEVAEFKQGIELPAWFKQQWPAFGCIAIGTNPLDEKQELRPPDEKDRILWVVKFMYFQKFEKVPWYVQPVRGGHLYRLTVWFDRPHDPKHRRRKWGIPQCNYIWVADDGNTMRALKTRQDGTNFRPPGEWVLDCDIEPEERKRGLTPQILLARRFCDAAKAVEQASYAMCRVEVSKGNLTATFGVDPRRMAYFFRDRDVHLTKDGATKPIFHSVRPHKRKDGSNVPMHFRGLREFTWADYNVCITVPGRDHFMLSEWTVGVEAVPKHGRWSRKKYLDGSEIAEKIKQNIKRGVGAHRP